MRVIAVFARERITSPTTSTIAGTGAMNIA